MIYNKENFDKEDIMYSIQGERIYNVNGTEILTVMSLAKLINRSVPTVRRLLSVGNRFRKLKVVYVDNKPFVPMDELYNFPYTLQGRAVGLVFHYKIVDNRLVIEHTVGYCNSDTVTHCDHDCKNCSFQSILETSEEIVDE